MVQIANVSYAPLIFRETAKDGAEGAIIEILPGETKPVDIDTKHHDVVARREAGLIVIGTKAQVEKAAREAPVTAPVTEPARTDKPA